MLQLCFIINDSYDGLNDSSGGLYDNRSDGLYDE
jgi:hypothetical protein